MAVVMSNDLSQLNLGVAVVTGDGSVSIAHPGHGEAYHSKAGAQFESRALYIDQSGIIADFESSPKGSVTVLDVGFGLGYTAFTTIDAWLECNAANDLAILSLEILPELLEVTAAGKGEWQHKWPQHWLEWSMKMERVSDDLWLLKVPHTATNKIAYLYVAIGDALDLSWTKHLANGLVAKFDYLWQDPFSPKSNPEMWTVPWLAALKEQSKTDAKMLTYSVARLVKDNLQAAGWRYQMLKGKKIRRKDWLIAFPTNQLC